MLGSGYRNVNAEIFRGEGAAQQTSSPDVILFNRSAGLLVAKSRTDFVFSGGICLRIIWPGGTMHSSRGMIAPEPTYENC